jgi:phage terminase large subunit GpA-like protein
VKAEKTSPDTLHGLSQHFLLVRVDDYASASWTTQSDHESEWLMAALDTGGEVEERLDLIQ